MKTPIPGLATAIALLLCTSAWADGIKLNRYAASETVEDGFYMSRPNDQGHLRLGVSLHLDYANDPLVYETVQGERDSELAKVVAHQLGGRLNIALGLVDRLTLFTALEANLLMKGDDWVDPETGNEVNTADGPGLGDVTFGARVRLVGEPEDLIGLALQATLIFPTAKAASGSQNYSGESSVSFIPEILFEIRTKVMSIGLNLGAQVRKDVDLGTADVRDDLLYGLGFLVPIIKTRLDFHLELFGSTPFKGFGTREASSMEILGGLKTYVGKKWAVGLAGGAGLTRGIGSPDARAVAMLGWVMPEKEPPPPPITDRDGDGLLDPDDTCPDEPEDKDNFEDSDGCPDPDNDKDGVLDVNDSCPLDPEDKDNFEDRDGCPDPDNDQDNFPDTEDECPDEPEDVDSFEDSDGCPDPDNDRDTVLDVDDKCPLSPGVPEEQGCPKAVKLDIGKGRIEILERVEFATGKDIILKRSEPILREVFSVINANPQIGRVRIEGHTDSRGKEKKNMNLSMRRADSVRRWLIEAGIDSDRLDAHGCGEALPIDTNKSEAGRQANRRVEFHITVPAPEDGARAPDECRPADW